jgi:hypothetical protein
MQVTPNFPLSRRRHLAGVTGGLARPFLAVLRSSAIGKGAFGVGILFNNPPPSGVLGSLGFSLCSYGKIKRRELSALPPRSLRYRYSLFPSASVIFFAICVCAASLLDSSGGEKGPVTFPAFKAFLSTLQATAPNCSTAKIA